MTVTAVVDAEGLWKNWANTQTTDLVGGGKPLAKGVTLKRLRSPANGAYAYVTRVGGDQTWLAETGNDRARLSASVYGSTKELAANAAMAYANKLLEVALRGGVLVTGQVKLQTIDAISGPLYLPDNDEERYLVDADFYFLPAP